MRLSCLLASTFLACTHPTAIAHQAASDDVPGPAACTVHTTAPEAFDATLQHNDQPGIDCFTSSWDDTFELGYAHAGWLTHLAIPRALDAEGAIDLASGSVALFYQPGACTRWTGTLTWNDAPDWAVTLDATCADDAAVRVVGAWSGR